MSFSATQNNRSAMKRVKDIYRRLMRAPLTSRTLLVKVRRDLKNQIRGMLKNLGLTTGHAECNVLAVRAKELIENCPGLVVAFVLIILLGPATAQSSNSAETAIREALMKWTSHFNAGDRGEICSLFAPDLRYDYRGHPERGFEDVCGLLQRSLSDRTRTYSYSLQIKEIIVSGDLAVVRLVWTLKVIPIGSTNETISDEPGMDIFRKQPDGSWKIARYIAYEN
jgi:ketosteroid isomerase-like protein